MVAIRYKTYQSVGSVFGSFLGKTVLSDNLPFRIALNPLMIHYSCWDQTDQNFALSKELCRDNALPCELTCDLTSFYKSAMP